jgi:ribonuclease G
MGGIIVVDFIDMQSAEHQRQVLRALEKATNKDRSKISVSGFSQLGLVEIARMRNRESLEHVLCETCSICNARGTLRSPETVCADIFREILRAAKAYDNDALLVVASQPIIDRLLDEDSNSVADLQDQLDKTIQFQVDPLYTQEQYDVVFL